MLDALAGGSFVEHVDGLVRQEPLGEVALAQFYGSLENIGITMHRLKTPELVQLYYGIYNPLTSQKQKFSSIEELNADKSAVL